MYWVTEYGEVHETRFIDVAKSLGVSGLHINPDKEKNPTVIDYVWRDGYADLKTQTTPFFTSGSYGIPSRFAVTFNRIDYERYSDYLAGGNKIYIFFWLNWNETRMRDYCTDYLFGVYLDDFCEIKKRIEAGAPEHIYCRRHDDRNRNARSSFLLDIRKSRTVIQIPERRYVHKLLLP